jgi:hypothetical protein
MNCFNIRELQGILKRKFFTDLVNTSESHKAMESTLINMRHKNNMSNILMYDQSLFYNFDLTNTSKSKTFNFRPGQVYAYADLLNLNFLSKFTLNTAINPTTTVRSIVAVLKDALSFIYLPSFASVSSVLTSYNYFLNFIPNSLTLNTPKLHSFRSYTNNTNSHKLTEESSNGTYTSSSVNHSSFTTSSPYNFSENSST